jgi:NAD(P)-dependent dehydrogenase (short-subunit alcohol dehydrogenase family)
MCEDFRMASSLHGKVAIVTGGSRGIGRAIAADLLAEGISVAIADTNPDHLRDAEAALLPKAANGVKLLTFTADVRDHLAVDSVVEETVRRLGGLDILVNNAGVGWFGTVESESHEDWRRVIDTNLTGMFNCCHSAIPHMRRRGESYIINISSLGGKYVLPGGAGYCASKAGVNAFSEVLLQEVRQDGIRVSYICPGSVNTDFMEPTDPGNDWKLRPEDVAQVVLELVRTDKRSLSSLVEIRPAKPPKK